MQTEASRGTSPSRRWWIAAATALFLLALAVRLHFQSHVQYVPYSDAIPYHDVGVRLAEEGIYSEPPWRAYRLPGYSAFLALVYAVAGPEPVMVHRVQAVLDSAACVGLAWLAFVMFGRPVGVCTGLLAAFHKVLVDMTSELLTESLFYPLSVGLLVCLWMPRVSSRAWWPALGGLCASIMLVTRSQLLVALPLVLVWCWFAWRDAWPSAKLRGAMVVLLLGVAFTLPTFWSTRNRLLFDGRVTGLATISWANLYWANVGIKQYRTLKNAYMQLPWPECEIEFAARCKGELLGKINVDRSAYAVFVLKRLRYNVPRYFFWRELYEPHWVFHYQPPWVLTVRSLGLLTLLGAVVCWRAPVGATLLFAYSVPQMALYLLVSNAGHRFSWPMTGLFCLFAAVGIVWLAGRGRRLVHALQDRRATVVPE